MFHVLSVAAQGSTGLVAAVAVAAPCGRARFRPAGRSTQNRSCGHI